MGEGFCLQEHRMPTPPAYILACSAAKKTFVPFAVTQSCDMGALLADLPGGWGQLLSSRLSGQACSEKYI